MTLIAHELLKVICRRYISRLGILSLDSWYHTKYSVLCIPCNIKQKSIFIYMLLNNSLKMF